MRKLGRSGYKGTPAAWVEFLIAWQNKKGIQLEYKKNLELDAYVRNFPIDAPASYKHFMAAWRALGEKKFMPVVSVDNSEFFNLRNPEAVECLAFCHSIGKLVLEENWELTTPLTLAAGDYRNYSIEQDDLPSYQAHFCSWVVANYRFIGGHVFILINPMVRSADGEWEACYFDANAPCSVRFLSFAELVVYLYINDIMNNDDFSWRGRDEDPTGLSKLLLD